MNGLALPRSYIRPITEYGVQASWIVPHLIESHGEKGREAESPDIAVVEKAEAPLGRQL